MVASLAAGGCIRMVQSDAESCTEHADCDGGESKLCQTHPGRSRWRCIFRQHACSEVSTFSKAAASSRGSRRTLIFLWRIHSQGCQAGIQCAQRLDLELLLNCADCKFAANLWHAPSSEDFERQQRCCLRPGVRGVGKPRTCTLAKPNFPSREARNPRTTLFRDSCCEEAFRASVRVDLSQSTKSVSLGPACRHTIFE